MEAKKISTQRKKLGFSELFLSTLTFLVYARVYVLIQYFLRSRCGFDAIYYSLGIIDIFRLRIQTKTRHLSFSLSLSY